MMKNMKLGLEEVASLTNVVENNVIFSFSCSSEAFKEKALQVLLTLLISCLVIAYPYPLANWKC